MDKGRVYELPQLMSQLEKEGGYFLDFLKIRNLEAGIIVLRPGEKDTQEPHSEDELYYIIKGRASMELGDKKIQVKEGSIVFIPAGLNHHFFGNIEDLVVLYMFAA